jgi:hypothetical protein
MRWLRNLALTLALLPCVAFAQVTESFTGDQDPLSSSANWDQAGATTDSGASLASEDNTYIDGSGNADDKSAYYVGTFANNQYAQIEFVGASAGAFRLGVILRGGSGNPALLVRYMHDSAQFAAYYWDSGGTRNQIGSNYTPSATFSVGDIMRAEISGTTLTLKIDYGAGFVTETTFNASSGPASGNPGVYIVASSDNDFRGDNWEGGDLAGGGASGLLLRRRRN